MDPRAHALRQLCATLRQLKVAYAVVGSLASSARGIPRSTLDGDLVAAIGVKDTERLAEVLGSDWYADPKQMAAAVSAGRSFNIIHQPAFLKFDIFPAIATAVRYPNGSGPASTAFYRSIPSWNSLM